MDQDCELRPRRQNKAEANKMPAPQADPSWNRAVREALRAELAEHLAQGGGLRHAIRSEVEAALSCWDGQSAKRTLYEHALRSARACQQKAGSLHHATGSTSSPHASPATLWGSAMVKDSDISSEASARMRSARVEHFAEFIEAHTRCATCALDRGYTRTFHWKEKVLEVTTWLKSLQEPPRTGCLARLVTGSVFEAIVCAVIFINCVFMVCAADVEIQRPHGSHKLITIVEWCFQILYTIEMAMKLIVHSWWFFCNKSWRVNIFDLVVVVSGFISLTFHRVPVNTIASRVLRMLRFGRAIRLMKAMSHLRHLRALLVCLMGSITSLFWSLAMLLFVYVLFSLFLIDIIVTHLQGTGEALEDTQFGDKFGSVGHSILTLFMASTGGDDWSHAYDVIQPTGLMGIAVYLIFIAFVQFALINLITGVFVESAMKVLSPDSEMLAQEHHRQEEENKHQLRQLCHAVDLNTNGKLTREEFEESLRRKHIPLLLTMLGLQRHHLLEVFDYMAEIGDDDQQVEISTFVNGCMLLKGAATNFDLQKLHAEVKEIGVKHDKDTNHILKVLSAMSQV